jgi:hypothetical protein
VGPDPISFMRQRTHDRTNIANNTNLGSTKLIRRAKLARHKDHYQSAPSESGGTKTLWDTHAFAKKIMKASFLGFECLNSSCLHKHEDYKCFTVLHTQSRRRVSNKLKFDGVVNHASAFHNT